MFGGQSIPDADNLMSDYVKLTRKEIIADNVDDVEKSLERAVRNAAQAICYNLNTMHSRAGSQVPFSSLNIGIPQDDDAALFCKCLLEEYDKGMGAEHAPFIFPSLIFRVKDGINKKLGDPYYYLFQLACKVTSTKMNPTYMNLDSPAYKEWFEKGFVPQTMGCRTQVMSNINGEAGGEGRGNIAPYTINMVRCAIEAMKEFPDNETLRINKFYENFDFMIEAARKNLLYRYDVLKRLKVKDLPFAIAEGLMVGSEGLDKNDSIEPVLKQGTWGIGFIGLAETLTVLTGKHHGESAESEKIGYEIITHLRTRCDEYKESDKLNWSAYATP